MKLNKTELCQILNIKLDTLRKIEGVKGLEERLSNKGYILTDRIKEGRNIYYIVELQDENKEVYSNLCKYVFNTNKDFEFAKYFINRIVVNDLINPTIKQLELSSNIGVGATTLNKWDNKMIDSNLMYKDGFYYICIDNENKQIYLCSKEEYNNYYTNKSKLNIMQSLEYKHDIEGYTIPEIIDYYKSWERDNEGLEEYINSKYYYKVKKYINNKNNNLYIDIIELINKLYCNIDIKHIEELN